MANAWLISEITAILLMGATGEAQTAPGPRTLLEEGKAAQAAEIAEKTLFAADAKAESSQEAYETWTAAIAATGDYTRLSDALVRKTKIAQRFYGDMSPQVALVQLELVQALRERGLEAQQVVPWNRALEIARSLEKAKNINALQVLTVAAYAARTQLRRQQVAGAFQTAIPALQQLFDANQEVSRDLARNTLLALGAMLIEMEKPRDAIGVLTSAVQLVHPDRAINDMQTAEIAAHLGKAHLLLGDLAKAQQFLGYTLSKYEPVYGLQNPMVAHLQGRLGYIQLRLGQRDDALISLRKSQAAIRLERQAWRRAALPTRVKLAAYNATFFDDEMLFSLELEHALKIPTDIAELVQQELGRKGALLEALVPPRQLANPAAVALRKQIEAISAQLAKAFGDFERNQTAAGQNKLKQLSTLRDDIEGKLAATALEENREAGPQDLAALCKNLPKNAVLLDYIHYIAYVPIDGGVRLTRKLASLLVKGQNCQTRLVDLGEALPLGQTVQAWRKALGQSAPVRGSAPLGDDPSLTRVDWHPGARDLYAKLLQPFEHELKSAELLVISPDDSLNFLPFAALEDPTGQFVMDRFALALVDSPRLQPFKAATTTGKGALILGNPAFGAKSAAAQSKQSVAATGACPAIFDTQWPELPGTQAESTAVAALFNQHNIATDLRQGKEATEKTLRNQGPGKRWLVLSTHGFFAPAPCQRDESNFPRDPLLLSGLVLAGANVAAAAGDNDGWVSAAELATLDLSSVELVVLSACETGLGDVQQAVGDGVFGLRRAIALAGAQGALMSLWQVADKETADLMQVFWQKHTSCRGDGCAPYKALREAQQDLRKRARGGHPYFWAGFVYASRGGGR